MNSIRLEKTGVLGRGRETVSDFHDNHDNHEIILKSVAEIRPSSLSSIV